MYSERMQILVSKEQRRRLEEEAGRTGTSVASLVRDAIDARYGRVTREERQAAAGRLCSGNAEFLPIEKLNEVLDSRFQQEMDRITDDVRRRQRRRVREDHADRRGD